MDKTTRILESEVKSTVDFPVLALLANGSSGQWSATLDEATGGSGELFLQIEGPSLILFCEVDDSDILQKLATALKASNKKQDFLTIGRVQQIPLRLHWDDETVCFTVGPTTQPIVRCSIHGTDIRDLADAIEQAALDLQ